MEKARESTNVDLFLSSRGASGTAFLWREMMEKRDFADMVIFFCQKVSEMNISRKDRMALLGMITAIEMKHDKLMPKWIHVSEKLPENYEQTICIDSRGKMMIGTYGEYGWTFPCYMTEPVAWMPMPKPWSGADNDR